MNYSFTVNKKDPKDKHDYDCIWQLFNENNIQIIYKKLHNADKEVPHLHYHGVIYTKYINIKEITNTIPNYRIEIRTLKEPERWFNYCNHEERANKSKLTEQIEELRGQNLLNRVMKAGQRSKLPRQQTIPTLMKLEFFTNI